MTSFDGKYLRKYQPDSDLANSQGSVRLHRLIAKEILGIDLKPGYVVHHINGDKTDNHPENLTVMTNSEHIKLHWKQGNYAKNCERIGVVICKSCGQKREHRGLGMCKTCYPREWYRKKIRDSGKEVRHRDPSPKSLIVCSVCEKKAKLEARKMCQQCYSRWKYQKKVN